MKNYLFIIFLFLTFITNAQLPYTWTSGVNPGWTPNGGDNNLDLQWQNCVPLAVVTTNCNGNYNNNNEYSIYTSPVINANCTNATTLSITFTASGNAEYTWDFLFVEYSLNGGITWINPYGVGVGWTGNFGAFPGSTIPPIITPTSSNFMFRFIFDSDNSFVYSGYKILDFDIVCNVQLPVELLYFEGDNYEVGNIIKWKTETENNSDYFNLEWTTNPVDGTWVNIKKIESCGNCGSLYGYVHNTFKRETINYYRLSQVDNDGKVTVYDPIAINNTLNKKQVLKVINTMGQTVDINTNGIVIIIYTDGKIERIFNN